MCVRTCACFTDVQQLFERSEYPQRQRAQRVGEIKREKEEEGETLNSRLTGEDGTQK